MAENKENGIYPKEMLIWYGGGNTASKLWDTTRRILGNRIDDMYYPKVKGGMYVIDVLAGGDGTLGLQVATLLKAIIPTSRPIILRDYCGTKDIPNYVARGVEEGYYAKEPEILIPLIKDHIAITARVFVLEDNRHVVVMIDKHSDVELRIYKK